MPESDPIPAQEKYKYLFFFTVLAFQSICLYLSWFNYISHSEFWPMSLAQFLGKTDPEYSSLYQKILFHTYLYIPYFFELTDVQHIHFSRTLFGFLAGVNFFLIGGMVYHIHRSWKEAFFYGAFLISVHAFTYNIFRVRADSMVLFFLLLSIHILYLFERKHLSKEFYYTILFISLTAMVLCTPKAIYSLILLLVFAITVQSSLKNLGPILQKSLLFVFLPGSLFVLFSLALVSNSDHTSSALENAFKHHSSSFDLLTRISGWHEFIASIEINFLHFLCLLVGLFFGFRSKEKAKAMVISLSLTSLLIICIHPQKWGYFLSSFYPFLFLPVLFLFQRIKTSVALFSLAFALICSASYMTHFSLWYFPNSEQIKTIQYISKTTETHQIQSFDGIGLLPRQNQLRLFLGPFDDKGNRLALKRLMLKDPLVIFYTSKMMYAPDINVYLYTDYDEIIDNIWVHKIKGGRLAYKIEDIFDEPLPNIFHYDHPIRRRRLLSQFFY
jgi:hypothetical protein